MRRQSSRRTGIVPQVHPEVQIQATPAALIFFGMRADTVPFIPRPFRPPLWARNAHVQTLAGKFLRPRPRVPLRRERWETPDGDFLLVDFADEGMEGAPAVLLLHGLEGSALQPYALLSYQALRRCGLAAVGLNFRSCGGEPNRLARSYHSGETGDPRWVLETLRARWPGRRLAAVAFSLGGNVLLKLLGDAGGGGLGAARCRCGRVGALRPERRRRRPGAGARWYARTRVTSSAR